ncbi:MAG: RnfH family protein [Gammaproteobacteria bacterium]|nr:RnfH family protein [Gammaproteobacteria bacterium]
MASDKLISVEVAYAVPEEQIILEVDIEATDTVEAAIQKSGILERFEEIDLTKNKVGIFGKLTKLDKTLNERDRIEIYRPLIADPKEVRKKRAAEGKRMSKGGGDVEPSS